MKTTFLTILAASAALFSAACSDEGNPPGPGGTGGGAADDGTSTGSATAGPFCGDGIHQEANLEICDGQDGHYIGMDCAALGWGTGTVACNEICAYTGCTNLPGQDDWGADNTGDVEPCDPEMVQYDCQGIAYGVYENRQGTKIMEVADGGGVSTGRMLACIGADPGAGAPQHHYVELPACGLNGAYSEDLAQDQCTAECEEMLDEGNPFPASITASGETWTLTGVDCFFGDAIESAAFGADVTNAISSTVALNSQGCGFGTPAPDSAVLQDGPVACGESTCAEIDCSEYTPATMVGSSRSGRTVKTWVDTIFAATIRDSMLLPFCGEGKYIWNSGDPTRARFDGLGAGEIFYEMGFRDGDRLLNVQEYIPNPSDYSTGTLTGTVYSLTTQADMLTAATGLGLFSPGEHFFRIGFKRGTSTYYNWVRIVDIPV